MNSQGGVIMNYIRMLWNGGDTILRCVSSQIGEKKFPKKWKMQKWQALVDKTHQRIRWKVEISSALYDLKLRCEGVS